MQSEIRLTLYFTPPGEIVALTRMKKCTSSTEIQAWGRNALETVMQLAIWRQLIVTE